MKRPKLRKASKRMTCAKRFKIQKKVREHHRKVRREAKKKGVSKRVKKDPGVPSSAPFKEEVLREAEQRRLQIEEQKEKQRQAKKEERAKKRKAEKEDGAKEPTAKKARQVEAAEKRSEKTRDKGSKQFMCSELNKVINASDVVIEVLDARDPLGCRCPQLEESVLSKNKKLLFLLNRIDLVPRQNVNQWLQHLQKEGPVVAFKASRKYQHDTPQSKKKRFVPSNDVADLSNAASCFGGSCLVELLSDYATSMKEGALLKVGVVGFPSVGKSSVINGVKGAVVCSAGVQRGLTKHMQEVHVAKNVNLLDSPALVASPSNSPACLALRSLQMEEAQQSVLEAVRVLLKQCDKTQVILQYNIPDYRNSTEFLTLLAKKWGFQKKGALDTVQAAVTFLNNWTGPRMSYYCKPPNSAAPPAYMSEAVVAQMKEGWDLQKLQTGNEATMNAVRFPNRMNGISFVSTGPTSGLLSVSSDSPPPATTSAEPESQPQVDLAEEPQHTEETKKTRVQFQSVDISAPIATSGDTYDFNTDFN
ncbi:guanine nucleotide-binding protein-like 3 isoform X1 [Synchiropus splendidus]|uniref:guanine nucleotide-binding protein-like 3 isoform X1 n=1 Tax=Synchiropus splendidus TaxID=270530 RepID=UPI00237ED9B9|nr:guanine nucleotide-binding protein-like 3 isoform X1 [Synchiropus splendidus]